jgi:hypothetical protein
MAATGIRSIVGKEMCMVVRDTAVIRKRKTRPADCDQKKVL